MKEKLKTVALFLVLAILINILTPTISAIAAEYDETINYNTYYQIQLNPNNSIVIASDDKTATINYDNGKATITGETLTKRGNELYSTSKFNVESVVPSTNYNCQIWYAGSEITLDTLNTNLSNLTVGERKNVDFQFEPKQSGRVTFSNATSISGNETSMTISYENGTATIEGTGLNTASDDGGKYVYTYDTPQVLAITVNSKEGYTSRVYYSGNQISTPFNLPINANDNINFDVNFDKDNGNNTPQTPTNKNATINLEHFTGTYEHTYTDEEGVTQTKTENYEIGADISINGYMLEPGDNKLDYYLETGKTEVTFTFSTLWHLRYYDTVSINGTPYNVSDYLNYDNQKQWLDHYNGQIVGFDINNVPVADTYNIEVKVGRQWGSHIANFLWTGDPAQKDGEDYIGNAHLEMIGLEYTLDGTTYTYTEEEFSSGSFDKDYVEYESDESLNYDEGSLVIPAGSKVTMRITPKYGYQVVASNMGDIETTDNGVCEFTFEVGGGAAYFVADVVKVEDVVKATSDKVSSGEIALANGSLTTGTAILSVNDIELDSDKISDFEEAAGDYKIKSYLDIDLDQVFYRGSSDSVWSNRIHELDDYATITLKLEDGIDGNDIVIVHNVNDGDKYEIIEIESYDAETNTITFKTKSFSNYAIASKTTSFVAEETKTTTGTNPITGDNIIMFISIFAIATLGVFITIKFNKNNKTRKH